jgi:hypothetical protein
MSKEIDKLINLIENTLSDDDILFKADKKISGYHPSAKGILNAFLQPGTEVLYLPAGQSIANAIRCTTDTPSFGDKNFSYQPREFTDELDTGASYREQGPVYKSRNNGPRLYGKAALNARKVAEFSLETEDGEEINCTIESSELKKKSFTRNKKRYVAVCVQVYDSNNESGLVIIKISLGNSLSPEESSARSEKIKMNRLNKINSEISELEARLKELYAKKEKLESK